MNGAILVTGGSGQVAQALRRAGGSDIVVVGRPQFDFDRPESLDAAFRSVQPALVINAAAWTAVDAAEAEPEAAMRANRDGAARIASLCRSQGAGLIHISTDYVFDGGKGSPYLETDPPNPACVYGRTKWLGEDAVRAACPDAVIVRTSWVYAPGGRNFVHTMLNAASRPGGLRVVSDQRGCPTNADDLARALLAMSRRRLAGGAAGLAGIYHAAGGGEATWFEFAEAIFQAAGRHGRPVPALTPIATADWPTPARRPLDSRLDCHKLEAVFGVALGPWQPSLARAVDAICGGRLVAAAGGV